MKTLHTLTLLLGFASIPVHAEKLVVVEDRGGASALPYYRSLNPQNSTDAPSPPMGKPDLTQAFGFPVKSKSLSPGQVQGRVINAPGLQPFFLIGDDDASRLWLLQHADALRQKQAMGLVVNVESDARMKVIQSWIPDVQIGPASGDDLAQRLGLRHYPALITATSIEQ